MHVIIARLGAIRTGAGESKTVAELLHRRLSIDSISDIGHLGAIPSLVLLPQSLNRTSSYSKLPYNPDLHRQSSINA
jgi:hypothetical protein